MISDDLSRHKNTLFICRKAREQLWILRRMITLCLSDYHLFDIYCKQIRSLLEVAVPVWHPAITQKDSKQIERIQKVAFMIILGHRYLKYEQQKSRKCVFRPFLNRHQKKLLYSNFQTRPKYYVSSKTEYSD